MIAVAVVGVLFGAMINAAQRHRAANYRANGEYLASLEREDLWWIKVYEKKSAEARMRGDVVLAARFTHRANEARGYAAEFSRLSRIYKHAASRPWEPLPGEAERLHLIPLGSSLGLTIGNHLIMYTGEFVLVLLFFCLLVCFLMLAVMIVRRLTRRNYQRKPAPDEP